MFRRDRAALARSAVVVVVIVIILIAGVGVYLATRPGTSTTTTTSSSSSSSSSSVSSVSSSSIQSSSSSSIQSSSSSSVLSSQSSSSSSTSSSSSAAAPSTLVIDDAAYPYYDLNEIESTSWPNWFMYDVYQPLILPNDTALYDSGVIESVPALAYNWTTPDNQTWTLNLLQNVTFSNGDAFNAYQVWFQVYSIYYLFGNSSSFLWGYPVWNMQNVTFGQVTINAINQSGLIHPNQQALAIMENSSWPIYVTGPYTIVFRMANPFSYFPALLQPMGIDDMQWVNEHGGTGTATSPNTYFNTNSIPGTGPYKVTGTVVNSYVSFTQNPTYWGDSLTPAQIAADPLLDPGHVKNVIVNFKADDLSRYTDLSTGAAQIVAIQAADWNMITTNPSEYSYAQFPPWSMEVTMVSLNTQEYPTNITDFRQAIVHAINYTAVNQQAFFGSLSSWMGPEYPTFKQLYDLGNYPPYSYNLTLAEQYLQESGVTNPPPLTYTIISACEFCLVTAQVVQADLAALNITVNIRVLTAGQYVTQYFLPYSGMLQNAQSLGQLTIIGGAGEWAPSALTPADNYVNWISNTSLNGDQAIYYNPVVQRCVSAFFNSGSNTSNIQALCAKAQTQIYNDAPYAWLGTVGLWWADGSLVWKNGVIKSMYLDPYFTGWDTIPFFNTVTFG
jgi:peptide/nickel transport system substrate-binding protein